MLWFAVLNQLPPLQAKAAVAPKAVIRTIAVAQVKSLARERLVR